MGPHSGSAPAPSRTDGEGGLKSRGKRSSKGCFRASPFVIFGCVAAEDRPGICPGFRSLTVATREAQCMLSFTGGLPASVRSAVFLSSGRISLIAGGASPTHAMRAQAAAGGYFRCQ
jgi:hypothetical protein